MWLSHADSEVNKFHPICEKALNAALVKLSNESDYRVLHHEYTGSLEMDFVVQNVRTKKYLCVIEVKRTPSDVNSARYQYQAMSYVQMNVPMSEKPYYILTNLEYAFTFRYDASRPRVFQQMLEPGLMRIGDFDQLPQAEFEECLSDFFAVQIANFLTDKFNYLLTLEQFEHHMKKVRNNAAKWKSSLVVLLYEYIRGAFLSIGRSDLPYDVLKFHSDVKRICEEAASVNFKEIFTFSSQLEKTVAIGRNVIANIFSLGKQNITGDTVADLLHSIVSAGMEHEGLVQTDVELARVVAVLAKSISGNISTTGYICDPAAGSGNLISSAIEIYGVSPNQIKANDVNERLLELLSLRIGLNFAKIVNNHNTAQISAKDIVDLPAGYFDDIAVIVLNPPFVAGINCVKRKQSLFKRIYDIKGENPQTDVGQMNLEGAFLETVCTLCKPNTVIACILPKTHLIARGAEAVALRQFLLSDFGLQAIFSYPEEGLFESVVKGTCVVIGKVRAPSSTIKFITSIDSVANIDLSAFEKSINETFSADNYVSIIPCIEGMFQTRATLQSIVKDGWRQVCREFEDAISFHKSYITPCDKLVRISDIPKDSLPRKRGTAGNSGASDLLMIDRDSELFAKNKNKPFLPAMRNAKTDTFILTDGDTVCFDSTQISKSDLSRIVDEYCKTPIRESRQQRKTKSLDALIELVETTAQNLTPANSMLIPRGIRTTGKVYVIKSKTVISTNFISVSLKSFEDALIFGSWVSTVFYQLICEINAKPQEGMRKMEVQDISTTYVPLIGKLTDEQKYEILTDCQNLEFLVLKSPTPRKTDHTWARILFGNDADVRLHEAVRLLDFLANMRNPHS